MHRVQHGPAVESGPEVEVQPRDVPHRPKVEAPDVLPDIQRVPVRLRTVIAQVNAVIIVRSP